MLAPIILTVIAVLAGVFTPIGYHQADMLYDDADRQTARAVWLTAASIAFVASILCGTFAVKEWIIYFMGSVPPSLREASFVVGGLAGLAGLIVFIVRAVRSHRDEDTDARFRHITTRNIIAAVLAGIMMIGCLIPAITGLMNLQSTEEIPDPGPAVSDRDDFEISATEETMNSYLLGRFNKSGADFIKEVSDASLPTHRAERNQAVQDAGFGGLGNDAMSSPMAEYETLLNKEATADELETSIEASRDEVDYLTLTDPIYALGRAERDAASNPEILRQNPGLKAWLDKVNNNVFAGSDPDLRGYYAMTQVNAETGQREWIPEHFWNVVKVVLLGDCFTWEKTVSNFETARNWHDSCFTTDPSLMRFVENDKQVTVYALTATHTHWFDDTNAEVTTIGYAVGDKRVLIPAAVKVEQPGDTGTGDPGSKKPVNYTLTIQFVDSNGKELVGAKTETHKGGESFTVYPEKIEGWTSNRDHITDTMPHKNHVVQFVYTKNGVTTYALTLKFWKEQIGGEAAAATQTLKYSPGQHTVGLPIVTGYMPKSADNGVNLNGSYSLPITMPASNYTVNVIYVKAQYNLNILYRSESGARMPGIADYKKAYSVGEAYNVPSPSAGNRYEANPAVVSGKMPDHDVTVTVTYYYLYEVNVSFKFAEDGRTAAPPYVKFMKNGSYYNVVPNVPDGYYAKPASVTGTIQGKDVIETIFFYKIGKPADGDNYKDDRTDPINVSQDGDPNKTNAEWGGNTNPLGSGQGAEWGGSELGDNDPTTQYTAPSGTYTNTNPPDTQGAGQNTNPPPSGTNSNNQSTVTNPQGTMTTPSDSGVNQGMVSDD